MWYIIFCSIFFLSGGQKSVYIMGRKYSLKNSPMGNGDSDDVYGGYGHKIKDTENNFRWSKKG